MIKIPQVVTKFTPVFGPKRKTNTGTVIIDVKNSDVLFQTKWMQIIFINEHDICVDVKNNKNVLMYIDQLVLEQCTLQLGLSETEAKDMYSPLLKNENLFYIPIGSKTITFDSDRNYYYKPDALKFLKSDDHDIRTLISFKKIQFKDYQISLQLDVQYIESSR